jgi:hypothetical protein
VKYKDITAVYRVALRHNPDHFYPNTFEIETEGHRLVLVAVAKKHLKKRLRIVGVLKPR